MVFPSLALVFCAVVFWLWSAGVRQQLADVADAIRERDERLIRAVQEHRNYLTRDEWEAFLAAMRAMNPGMSWPAAVTSRVAPRDSPR